MRTEEVVAAIEAAAPGARIDFEHGRAAVPVGDRGAGDADPLEDGVADAVARFRALLERGLVSL